MSTRNYKIQFAGPEKLRALQDIFNMAWQELNARGENANWLRSELAEAIMAVGHQEPMLIRELIMEEIRRGNFHRRLNAAA
jgi:hypothetical protein